MDDTETKQPAEAEKKPAKPRKTTVRKAAAKADGDAGTAASKPKAAKARTTKKAAKAEETATAPAPEKPAKKKAAPKAKPAESAPAAAEAPKPAPRPAEDDIPNPDAHNVIVAPGFATPETVGGNEGGGRRKRRRNRNRNKDGQQQPQPQQSPRVDPDELVRRAWKIYLGEVTEEGLALMDDRTAQEASRRAFRVAEHFLVEAARHRRPVQQPQQQQPQAQPQQQPKPEEPAPEQDPEAETPEEAAEE